MVVITFPNETGWFKANWAYRQLAKDFNALFPLEVDLNHLMAKGQAFGGLDFRFMEKDVVVRMLNALKTVCHDTIEGKIRGLMATDPRDSDGQRMYIESILELLYLVNRQINEL